jgi:DNA-binding NtrC family response regulator
LSGEWTRVEDAAPGSGDVDDVVAETLSVQVGASLREVEKRVIEATLRHCDGNRTLAAKILGIDRSTLYEKIKKYRLKR